MEVKITTVERAQPLFRSCRVSTRAVRKGQDRENSLAALKLIKSMRTNRDGAPSVRAAPRSRGANVN
jgi:hypothetical protein